MSLIFKYLKIFVFLSSMQALRQSGAGVTKGPPFYFG